MRGRNSKKIQARQRMVVTSCLSHAALINLAVFLVFCLPWTLTHHEKIGRTLTKETMPVAWQFAKDNQWYHNHFSSSNGTRYSIFGMFFSVPSIYWNSMESGHVSPPFINTLLNECYNIHAFIAPGDVILKKEGDGSLTITDKHLRPLPGYHVSVKQFNQAMDCLNRYFKK